MWGHFKDDNSQIKKNKKKNIFDVQLKQISSEILNNANKDFVFYIGGSSLMVVHWFNDHVWCVSPN